MQVAKVYKLMKNWEADPCWDLENDAYSPEYAPYRQILLDFAKKKRKEWKKKAEQKAQQLRELACPFSFLWVDYGKDDRGHTWHNCLVEDCALWDKNYSKCAFRVISMESGL